MTDRGHLQLRCVEEVSVCEVTMEGYLRFCVKGQEASGLVQGMSLRLRVLCLSELSPFGFRMVLVALRHGKEPRTTF